MEVKRERGLRSKIKCVDEWIERYKDRYDGKLRVVKINDTWYELEEV